MRKPRFPISAVALLSCLQPGAAAGGGGMYFDSLSVTNGGQVVFLDDFDDGNISDWREIQDVYMAPRQGKLGSCVYVNRRNPSRIARAFHSVLLDRPSAVEVSAEVYLPSPRHQYNWDGSRTMWTGIIVYSGSTEDHVCAAVELCPKHDAYRARVQRLDSSKKSSSFLSLSPKDVVQPGRWARMTLRLDPKAGTAAFLLDGTQVARTSYAPERFQSIKGLALQGDLGDWGQ